MKKIIKKVYKKSGIRAKGLSDAYYTNKNKNTEPSAQHITALFYRIGKASYKNSITPIKCKPREKISLRQITLSKQNIHAFTIDHCNLCNIPFRNI